MRYIANSFSLNMIHSFPAIPVIGEVTLAEVRAAVTTGMLDTGEGYGNWLLSDVIGGIGHADTAAIVDASLGIFHCDTENRKVFDTQATTSGRITVTLTPSDVLYVAQYRGPRLPEGTTVLPEGSTIQWYEIRLAGAVAEPSVIAAISAAIYHM